MNARQPNKRQERVVLVFEHGQLTATTTIKLFKARRRFHVDSVEYINPTGLAADATNAFRGEVKNGSTLVASIFNTDSNDDPAGAALPADTHVAGVLAASKPDRGLAKGDVLSLVLTEDGTATLPPGRLQVEGRYI